MNTSKTSRAIDLRDRRGRRAAIDEEGYAASMERSELFTSPLNMNPDLIAVHLQGSTPREMTQCSSDGSKAD